LLTCSARSRNHTSRTCTAQAPADSSAHSTSASPGTE
jgi:hypothetical protein